MKRLCKTEYPNVEITGCSFPKATYPMYTYFTEDKLLKKAIEGGNKISHDMREYIVNEIGAYFMEEINSDQKFFRQNITNQLLLTFKSDRWRYLPDSIVDYDKLYNLGLGLGSGKNKQKKIASRLFKVAEEKKEDWEEESEKWHGMKEEEYVEPLEHANLEDFPDEENEEDELEGKAGTVKVKFSSGKEVFVRPSVISNSDTTSNEEILSTIKDLDDFFEYTQGEYFRTDGADTNEFLKFKNK